MELVLTVKTQRGLATCTTGGPSKTMAMNEEQNPVGHQISGNLDCFHHGYSRD